MRAYLQPGQMGKRWTSEHSHGTFERNRDFAAATASAIASIRAARGNAMDAELMKVGELLLPKRLVALIDTGLWPHTAEQAWVIG